MPMSRAHLSSSALSSSCSSGRWRSSAPTAGSVGTESSPLEDLPCLPRLGLRRAYPNQFLVGEASAEHRCCHSLESVSIVGLAGVVSESLFGQIPKQMDYFDIDVGAADCPLQQAPEVLDAVGVDVVTEAPPRLTGKDAHVPSATAPRKQRHPKRRPKELRSKTYSQVSLSSVKDE